MSNILKSPFPYFGGKSKIAGEIWKRMGRVDNVVEPFFGSGAFLLARPMDFDCTETVNDADGFVSNFWRALKSSSWSAARWHFLYFLPEPQGQSSFLPVSFKRAA